MNRMPRKFPIVGLIPIMMLFASQAMAAWPPSRCDHVRILGAGDDDEIVEYDNARLQNADPRQKKVLGSALEKMPEVLCQAVRRVAFIYRPPEDEDDENATVVDAWTNRNENQDLVYLNTWGDLAWDQNKIDRSPETRAKGVQRFIHESTHTAIRMIQSQQKAEPYRFRQERADPDIWPPNAQQLAKNVVKDNRLETGIIREWQRMHNAFVSAGMAQEYDDKWTARANQTSEEITTAGFTSAYGSEQAIEDIAEMASWAIVRGEVNNSEDAACRVMNRSDGSGIRSNQAAIYTKMGFIRTLGFISEQAYQDCVSPLKIEAPGTGFFSYRDGNLSKRYTSNPRAGVGRGREPDEQWLLANITADGTASTSSGDFPATISMQLNVTPLVDAITDPGKRSDRMAISPADVSYPRGVYFIGFRHSKLNRLTITNKDDGKTIMDVGQGVALISRSGSDGIGGSIAVHRIFNFSGGMLSAIAGDEPVNGSKIAFKYDPN